MAQGKRLVAVTDPEMLVRWGNGRILMTKAGTKVAAIPVREVAHLALHGPITITGAAMMRLLDAGIDISLHTRGGQLRGHVSAKRSKDVVALLAQVAAWRTPERRLLFARTMISSKLEGQRRMLQRHGWNHEKTACLQAAAAITKLIARVQAEQDLDALRGLEGAAAAAYFGVFGQMLRNGWAFPGRVRRPPTDPVNALLSYGYALLSSEVTRRVIVRGLDPRIGLFHGIRYGRSSLPLDMIEELRAPVVDRLVLKLLNRRQLTAEHFMTLEDGAVRLTPQGRRVFITRWEEHLEHPRPGVTSKLSSQEAMVEDDGEGEEKRPAWRKCISRQVARLKRFLMEEAAFKPLYAVPSASPSPSVSGG